MSEGRTRGAVAALLLAVSLSSTVDADIIVVRQVGDADVGARVPEAWGRAIHSDIGLPDEFADVATSSFGEKGTFLGRAATSADLRSSMSTPVAISLVAFLVVSGSLIPLLCLAKAKNFLPCSSGESFPSEVEYSALPAMEAMEEAWVVNGEVVDGDSAGCLCNATSSSDSSQGERKGDSRTARFFWIGDSDCGTSHDEQDESRTPLRTPPTESEPELELDPLPHAAISSELAVVPQQHRPMPLASVPLPTLAPSAPGRLALLYSSPLCYSDSAGRAVPMPQISFDKEWDVLTQAYNEAALALRGPEAARSGQRSTPRLPLGSRPCGQQSPRLRPGVTLASQPLTSKSLQQAVAPGSASSGCPAILHLSAHGVEGGLILEDGKGTAHLLSNEQLRGILELPRKTGPKLVLLNSCKSLAAGGEFVSCGVPHVICTSAELRDSASRVFLGALYRSLFQGDTVAHAFSAAVVALRSDPEASTRDAAACIHLLPEGAAHSQIVFQPETQSPTAQAHCATRAFPAECEKGSASARSLLSGMSSTTVGEAGSSTDESSSGSDSACAASSSTEGGGSEEVDASSDSDGGTGCRKIVAKTSRPINSRGLAARSSERRRVASTFIAFPRHRSQDVWQSPLGLAVPAVPEDFLGRMVDTWTVLQHLSARRATVVCAAPGAAHGIGKSAVLDATHRVFAHQMNGVCVAVHLQSLSAVDLAEAASERGWIGKVREAVQVALCEHRDRLYQRQLSNSPLHQQPLRSARRCFGATASCGDLFRIDGLPRRSRSRSLKNTPVSAGFHALSDPLATQPLLEELIVEMTALAELCEARCRDWPAAGGRILLVLDECDHLIQQKHFQIAIASVLRRCPSYRILLSTQQRMVGVAGGQFKVVQHELQGLAPKDAARLFLRRAQRPLRWGELQVVPSSGKTCGPRDVSAPVALTRENESEVLELVARHPAVAAQRGNPRLLIELASKVSPSLESLSELA